MKKIVLLLFFSIITFSSISGQESGSAFVGINVGGFFANKNTDPQALMSVATWWIATHQLDHFEKAVKIRAMVEAMD
mgnify:CR=1 FL=1